MKIGIDITPVIYQGTGVATYTRQLVTNLLKISPSTTHFTLFASTLRGQKKLASFLRSLVIYKNFSTKILPLPTSITELAWNKLHRFPIEKFTGPLDVFHAWDWQQPPATSAKLVTTIHDLTSLLFPKHHHPKTITVHKRRLHWVKKEASAIITDSLSTKNDVIKHLNITPSKIHVIPLAAGNQFASPSTSQIKKVSQKYNLTKNYILSVGTQEPRKNLSRVIKAFQELQSSSHPELHLVIAGKYGWGKSQQKAKNIRALGYVKSQDLPPLYAGAKAFVYPSLYEGFGLPVLEAMSIGTPVVTSNKGSLKEVAGKAAITIDPQKTESIAAGIKTALENPVPLIKLGLKQAQKFSWTTTAQQTLNLYLKLVTCYLLLVTCYLSVC